MRLSLIAVTTCLLAAYAHADDSTWQHAIRDASRPSVVFITVTRTTDNDLAEPETGTGFLVTTDGYLLTCNHLLGSGQYKSIAITGAVGDRHEFPYPLTIVKQDPALDLVLLRFNTDKTWPALQVCTTVSAKTDDSVFALGYPLEENLIGVTGAITSMTSPGGHWRTSAPLNHGMSGAPVFNTNGDVVAIAAGGMENAQLLNDVIPLRLAVGLLDIAGAPRCPTSQSTRLANLRVAPEPDTVAITPGQLKPIAYQFKELAGVDVDVQTQDNQFLTTTGTPIGLPCAACRILGGNFRVEGGGQYKLWDNVLLPLDVAAAAAKLGVEAVHLRTIFNGKDKGGNPIRVTAILRIIPFAAPQPTNDSASGDAGESRASIIATAQDRLQKIERYLAALDAMDSTPQQVIDRKAPFFGPIDRGKVRAERERWQPVRGRLALMLEECRVSSRPCDRGGISAIQAPDPAPPPGKIFAIYTPPGERTIDLKSPAETVLIQSGEYAGPVTIAVRGEWVGRWFQGNDSSRCIDRIAPDIEFRWKDTVFRLPPGSPHAVAPSDVVVVASHRGNVDPDIYVLSQWPADRTLFVSFKDHIGDPNNQICPLDLPRVMVWQPDPRFQSQDVAEISSYW